MTEEQTIKTIQLLIKRGYGYNQMIEELGIDAETLSDILANHLIIKNIVEKRYKINLSKVESKRKDNHGRKRNTK
jgi:hypothetical protein